MKIQVDVRGERALSDERRAVPAEAFGHEVELPHLLNGEGSELDRHEVFDGSV